MPLLSQTQFSFAAGELTPALHGRGDLGKYQSGLKTARNVFVHTYGGASNRPGTYCVGRIPFLDTKVRQIDFQFGDDEACVLVFGKNTLRFIARGGFVLEKAKEIRGAVDTSILVPGHGFKNADLVFLTCSDAALNGQYCLVTEATEEIITMMDLDENTVVVKTGTRGKVARVYTLETPYSCEDLNGLRYAQAFDVMILSNKGYAPQSLSRKGHTDWTLTPLRVTQKATPPTSVNAVVGKAGYIEGNSEHVYQVTTLSEDGEESQSSSSASCINNLAFLQKDQDQSYNTVSWSPVPKAVRYRVYKRQGGTFGFIGSTEGNSLNDNNILPNMTITSPGFRNPFANRNNPRAVTFCEQRLVLAGSHSKPQTVWTSGTGNYRNFNVSTPVRADEAITLTLASDQLGIIQHLVMLKGLLVLTTKAEWTVSGGSGPLVPNTVAFYLNSHNGCTDVKPLIINDEVLFISARGSVVRNLAPRMNAALQIQHGSDNLSLLAAHLFEEHEIISWAYAKVPHNLIWAVRDDGVLLSLTYLPEQQVIAWCQHDTDGYFEDVTAVEEDKETAVYFVVRRDVNGRKVRFIERLASRKKTEQFFVDCGLTYQGPPTQSVGNLHHLEGKEVVALADGNVVRDLTVKNGQVKLPRLSSIIHVGLPYTAEIETLPLSFGAQTTGGAAPSKPKRITGVTLNVQNTRGLWAGPDAENLDEYKQRSTEAWGEPVRPTTGVISQRLSGSWRPENTVLIQQRDPLPMTVLAVTPEVAVSQ